MGSRVFTRSDWLIGSRNFPNAPWTRSSFLLINRQWTSPALDRLMAAVSSWDAWLPLFFLLGAALLIRGGFRLRAFVIVAVLVVGVNDGIVSRVMKRAVDRPRPHQSHNDVRMVDLAKARPRFLAFLKEPTVKLSRISLQDVEGRSFPSAHTLNFFSLSLVAVAFFGRAMSWLFAIAALVGYSRIYTGAHWPSDVFTTIFLAFGSTLLLLALLEWAWRKHGARGSPARTWNTRVCWRDEAAHLGFRLPHRAHRAAVAVDWARGAVS